jgi:hypothetical protein
MRVCGVPRTGASATGPRRRLRRVSSRPARAATIRGGGFRDFPAAVSTATDGTGRLAGRHAAAIVPERLKPQLQRHKVRLRGLGGMGVCGVPRPGASATGPRHRLRRVSSRPARAVTIRGGGFRDFPAAVETAATTSQSPPPRTLRHGRVRASHAPARPQPGHAAGPTMSQRPARAATIRGGGFRDFPAAVSTAEHHRLPMTGSPFHPFTLSPSHPFTLTPPPARSPCRPARG